APRRVGDRAGRTGDVRGPRRRGRDPGADRVMLASRIDEPSAGSTRGGAAPAAGSLGALLAALDGEGTLVRGDAATPIRAVSSDSRQIAPGMLFVAIAGTHADGVAFVRDAVS